MSSNLYSKLAVSIFVAVACSTCTSAQDRVYKYCLGEIKGRLQENPGLQSEDLVTTAHSLMTIEWPLEMQSEVNELLRKLCEGKGVSFSAQAVCMYALTTGELPNYMQESVVKNLSMAEGPERVLYIASLCKASAVPRTTLPALNLCLRENDIVVSTAAAVALLHSAPNGDVEQSRLRKLLQSDNPEVQLRAADRLALLPSEQIMPFLEMLQDGLEAADVRVQATFANAILTAQPTHERALQIITSLSQERKVVVCVGYVYPSNPGISVSEYAIGVLKTWVRHLQACPNKEIKRP